MENQWKSYFGGGARPESQNAESFSGTGANGKLMENHWNSMKSYGKPVQIDEIQWNLMETQWDINGIQCNPMENQWEINEIQ